MFKILVVDDMAVIREPVTSALRANGYDAVPAASGAEALTLLKAGAVDVILLDLMMPGMDGITTLEAIRELPAHRETRVILLTASGDREMIIHAGKLGVRDYLLKSSFIMKDLLGRLKKYLVVEEITDGGAVTSVAAKPSEAGAAVAVAAPAEGIKSQEKRREATLRRITDAQIKALPGTVSELLVLTNTARCDATDVAAVLKRDPVLSMRILRIANSAAFATARARIGTVEEAVKHIGMREIHRVAASVGIFETFGTGGAGLDLLRTWQHSLAVGRLMETFAKGIEGCDAGLAYTIGLCHDLPDIMLHQYLPEESASIARLVENGMARRQVETEVMGLSYAETASHWLPRLRLHSSISGPITAFYGAIATGRPAFHGEIMPTLLHLADMYANAVMLGRCVQDGVGPITNDEYQSVGGTLPRLDPEAVRLEATSVLGMFGDFPSADIRKAAEQPLPNTPVHVLYVRDVRFAEFDPLQAALELLAERVTLVTDVRLIPEAVEAFDAAIVADVRGELGLLSGRCALPVLQLVSGAAKAGAGKRVRQGRFPVALGEVSAFLEQAQQSLAKAG